MFQVKHKHSQNKYLESVWEEIEPRQNLIISENNKRSNGKDLNCSINRDDPKNDSISQLAKNCVSNLNHSSRSENKSGRVNAQGSLNIEDSPQRNNISNMNQGRKSICRDLFGQKAKSTDNNETHDKHCKFVSGIVCSPYKSSDALKDTVGDNLNHQIDKTQRKPFLHQSSDSEDSDYPSLPEKRSNILNSIFPRQTNDFANSNINDYKKTDLYEVEDLKKKHILLSSESESTSDNALAEKRKQILNRIFPQRSRELVPSKVDVQGDSFSSSKKKSKNHERKQLKKLQKASFSTTIEGKVIVGKNKIRKINEKDESFSYESDKDMDFKKKHKQDSNIHAVWSEKKYIIPELEEIKSNSTVLQSRSAGDIANSKINNDEETHSCNIRGLSEKKNKSYMTRRNKDMDFSKKHKMDSKINAVWSEIKYIIPELEEIKSNSRVIQSRSARDIVDLTINNDEETDSCNIRGLPEKKNKSYMTYRKGNILTSSDSEDSNNISPADKRKQILNRIFPQKSRDLVFSKVDSNKLADSFNSCIKKSKNYKTKQFSDKKTKVSSSNTMQGKFKIQKKKNNLGCEFSNSITGGIELQTNTPSKLCRKRKREDKQFSLESDEEHSKTKKEKSKKNSLRSEKTNAVPELKEKDVLPNEW